MTAIQQFEYEGQFVDFDFSAENIMVNATEMVKIYNKRMSDFFESSTTQSFIKECLNNGNSRYLGIEKEADLYTSKRRTGTWMHRVLALKFAAWLDPAFELWVFCTIDRIMFGSLREDVKAKAEVKKLKDETIEKLMKNPDYLMLLELESKDKEVKGKITKQQSKQIDLFS
jgi:hypothetical protein